MIEVHPNTSSAAEPHREDSASGLLTRIRELVSQEKLASARRLSVTAVEQYPNCEELRLLRKALHAGEAFGHRLANSAHRENMGWLSHNQKTYVGKWVALVDGKLVAAEVELRNLLASLKKLDLNHRPLIHHIRG